MATTSTSLRQSPGLSKIFGRLGLMAIIVVALIVLSTPLRTINPLQLRIATNILFFVVLGMADAWLLAPVLNRWPLARAVALVTETLLLGWFFSPGRVNPVHKFLFFTHIGPFFGAVFVGALLVSAFQWWKARQS